MLVITHREALIKWTAPCKQKDNTSGLEIIDKNKMILLCHYFEAENSKQNLPSCLCFFFFSCLCLSSLTNHQESRLQQPSLKANQDQGWLNHQAFSWSSEPIVKALGQTCELAAGGSTWTGSCFNTERRHLSLTANWYYQPAMICGSPWQYCWWK